ncbi:hypothetical protein, partial [Halostella sp. PRR32]|uniref:hypothetical protein n=1 Tax=Halostella sp. PRR32 TaxID=3098147 RepID=UPI002B1CEEE9
MREIAQMTTVDSDLKIVVKDHDAYLEWFSLFKRIGEPFLRTPIIAHIRVEDQLVVLRAREPSSGFIESRIDVQSLII